MFPGNSDCPFGSSSSIQPPPRVPHPTHQKQLPFNSFALVFNQEYITHGLTVKSDGQTIKTLLDLGCSGTIYTYEHLFEHGVCCGQSMGERISSAGISVSLYIHIVIICVIIIELTSCNNIPF